MSLLRHVGTWAFLPLKAGFQAFSHGRFIGKEQARCLFRPVRTRIGQIEKIARIHHDKKLP